MPTLPLDHPEPFAATVGVMLYPGDDADSRQRARAFTAQYLAVPLKRFHAAGYTLPYEDLARIAADAGSPLEDIEDRWRDGICSGQLFTTLFSLAHQAPALASWGNATKLVARNAAKHGVSASRSDLYEVRRRYASVAHLWAAFCIRGQTFEKTGYKGWRSFQWFLTEAEILRQWSATWRPSGKRPKPSFARRPWRLPPTFQPPADLPATGRFPVPALPENLIRPLKGPGRPRKTR